MTNQNNELDKILSEITFHPSDIEMDIERRAYTKQQIQALYAPKPVENGELDLYRALQTLKDQDDNYVLSTISFSSQYGLQRLIEFIEARLAQEEAKWGQIVLEDVIGPNYFFTDDAMPTEAEKVTQASLNRLLERQRQALAKLLDKENV